MKLKRASGDFAFVSALQRTCSGRNIHLNVTAITRSTSTQNASNASCSRNRFCCCKYTVQIIHGYIYMCLFTCIYKILACTHRIDIYIYNCEEQICMEKMMPLSSCFLSFYLSNLSFQFHLTITVQHFRPHKQSDQ